MSAKTAYILRFNQDNLPNSKDEAVTEKYQIMSREALGLFIEKNNAYRSIFLEYGVTGIFVRIRDKLTRLFSTDETLADESVTENFLDIANYALMGAIISHFDIKKGDQCEHLYAVIADEAGNKILRCINCNSELNL